MASLTTRIGNKYKQSLSRFIPYISGGVSIISFDLKQKNMLSFGGVPVKCVSNAKRKDKCELSSIYLFINLFVSE